MCMHSYQPFGITYYQPLLDFQLKTLRKYKDEFDTLYLIEDDNWELPEQKEDWIKIIKVPVNLRYYDAYKEVLPQVKEDLVLFMDNDLIIYKKNIIARTFNGINLELQRKLVNSGVLIPGHAYNVVSITDTIGTMKVPLKTGNKLCPYFFATRKELLMKYLDIDWGPNMPYTETFGLLTEALLKDGAKVYEMPDDKDSLLFDEILKTDGTQSLGYYHIRAGSTPAYLLATKEYGDRKTYDDYLKNQPRSEYLRQMMWFWFMIAETGNMEVGRKITEVLDDMKVTPKEWTEYTNRFIEYHGL